METESVPVKLAAELCQLCHEREPDEGMLTCWECRRGTDDMERKVVPAISFKRAQSCRDCGETDPSKFYASVRTFCKECHQVRGRAAKKARIAARRAAAISQVPTGDALPIVEASEHAAGDPVAVVVLKVFGREDVELLDRLQELARRERRSISQQVLFLIQDLIL